ncbi:MAG: amidohydrolase [Candidatus Bathyarchaeota archaeon]|nr:amidohydrolase [Candidatus Bathyarchaeota archaeon]
MSRTVAKGIVTVNGETLADLALIDGKIYTMNKSLACAEAVAVKGDQIIKVDTTEEVTYLIGKDTQIVYLDGRTVLPGFIDTHIHVADFGRFLMWMDLAANSISQMQVLLGSRLEGMQPDKWVVGRGWNETRFTEKRLPTRHDLDVISPNNPVLFYHQNGQIALVNSKALELAGVTKATEAPLGGFIDRNGKGEPTGILRETATDLVWKMVPEPTLDELVDAAALACEKIVQAGITSIHWLAESAMDVQILKRLLEAGKMPLRVYMVIPANLLSDSGLLEGLEKGSAKIGGVEVCADGYLASRTAALAKPYLGDAQGSGKLTSPQKDLAASAKNVVERGFQLVMHAMGDKAVDAALNVIESADDKGRHRIDPAALLNPALIQRLKKAKVVVSVQPLVAVSEFSVYDAVEHLGEERARWLYPLKTLFGEGVCVCGGSDCPMEPLNPMLGIQSAVTRRFYPEEQLSVDEALQMYTTQAAWASGEEKVKGSIEEGKLADFTVLAQDPHEVPISQIQDIAVEMTVIGGKVAYSRN